MLMQDNLAVGDVLGHDEMPLSSRVLFGSGQLDGLESAIAFRNFRIWPRARLLMRGDDTLCIGSRAFDLLMVLLSSRGEVVQKSALLRLVWPDTIVDESNLRFQIAALRKVLGKDRDLIMSIPGRGYFFTFDAADEAQPQQFAVQKRTDELPPTEANNSALQRVGQMLDRSRSGKMRQNLSETDLFNLMIHLAGMLATESGSLNAAHKP